MSNETIRDFVMDGTYYFSSSERALNMSDLASNLLITEMESGYMVRTCQNYGVEEIVEIINRVTAEKKKEKPMRLVVSIYFDEARKTDDSHKDIRCNMIVNGEYVELILRLWTAQPINKIDAFKNIFMHSAFKRLLDKHVKEYRVMLRIPNGRDTKSLVMGKVEDMAMERPLLLEQDLFRSY